MMIDIDRLSLIVGDRVLIDSLTLEMCSGEIWGVMGGNGRGKSTLLQQVVGLLPIVQGAILLNKINISQIKGEQLAKMRSYCPQTTVLPPFLQVAAIVEMTTNYLGQRIDRQQRLYQQFDLEGQKFQLVSTLSGGEQQRLQLLLTFLQSAHVTILDEPFNHLDLKHVYDVVEVICQLSKEGGTTVLALHDIALAKRLCSHILLLKPEGRWVAGTTSSVLMANHLSQAYEMPEEYFF